MFNGKVDCLHRIDLSIQLLQCVGHGDIPVVGLMAAKMLTLVRKQHLELQSENGLNSTTIHKQQRILARVNDPWLPCHE
jgi:hypothetical protein